VPDDAERAEAFAAVENIPSIQRKAQFCFRWIDSVFDLRRLESREDRRAFLLNLICFAACIEGLFFYGAFAYVCFLRSRGLLHGLASGTNWVFRDESMHMAFAFDVVEIVRAEESALSTPSLSAHQTWAVGVRPRSDPAVEGAEELVEVSVPDAVSGTCDGTHREAALLKLEGELRADALARIRAHHQ
jgi:ribonucleoside-diphosphate reductase beta chain